MTLAIVKRTEEDFAEWLATEGGFLSGLGSFDGEPIVLEPYQLAFLKNRSRFRWITKGRQVGFSFLFALEALARCHLRPKNTAVFVSYNLDDPKEKKILIVRQVHEELPLAYQKRLVVDSKTELAFESSGAQKRLSLRRLLAAVSVARLSIDHSSIGMNLAENLARDFPQVVAETFTAEAKERWATDFKILLQRRDLLLPRDRQLVAQIQAIKRRVLPSGKVSFDAERSTQGHVDKFWAVALACQRERMPEKRKRGEINVRIIG